MQFSLFVVVSKRLKSATFLWYLCLCFRPIY